MNLRASPDSGLNAQQVTELTDRLRKARAALSTRRGEQVREAVSQPLDVGDEMDSAAVSDGQATLLGLAATEGTQLAEIDAALARLEDGSYGVDEDTGEPIGYPRLAAIPWTRHTIARAEELERVLNATRR